MDRVDSAARSAVVTRASGLPSSGRKFAVSVTTAYGRNQFFCIRRERFALATIQIDRIPTKANRGKTSRVLRHHYYLAVVRWTWPLAPISTRIGLARLACHASTLPSAMASDCVLWRRNCAGWIKSIVVLFCTAKGSILKLWSNILIVRVADQWVKRLYVILQLGQFPSFQSASCRSERRYCLPRSFSRT
jgi:hypothetical protein